MGCVIAKWIIKKIKYISSNYHERWCTRNSLRMDWFWEANKCISYKKDLLNNLLGITLFTLSSTFLFLFYYFLYTWTCTFSFEFLMYSSLLVLPIKFLIRFNCFIIFFFLLFILFNFFLFQILYITVKCNKIEFYYYKTFTISNTFLIYISFCFFCICNKIRFIRKKKFHLISLNNFQN